MKYTSSVIGLDNLEKLFFYGGGYIDIIEYVEIPIIWENYDWEERFGERNKRLFGG
jgi:hypothetical protein